MARILSGYSPRRPADEGSDSGWRIVLGRHADEEGIDWPGLSPCEPAKGIERFEIREGDVLLTTRTTLLRAVVAHGVPPRTVASAQFAIVRPLPERLDPTYLAWLLNRADVRERLRGLFKGSSIQFLPITDLAPFQIHLPPLERQHAIAHVLELRQREAALRRQLDQALDVLVDAASRTSTTP